MRERLVFTVTNDLTYDQRMIRICTSLQSAGYPVTLVGRQTPASAPPGDHPFHQVRLRCFFNRGPLFYAEFNVRLLLWLLFAKADLVCAIDLDTILPCLFASRIRRMQRVYDAHELFCEMKEIVTRKHIYAIWKGIERFAVPRFQHCYTVNDEIAAILQKEYGILPGVIRNIPPLQPPTPVEKGGFIIYQGAVNEGRSFETLIPAFRDIHTPLFIYGDGNYLSAAQVLVAKHGLQDRVLFKGKCTPGELRLQTPAATLGLTLFENEGLSNYYSLANRFFDYIHAGIPQVCVDFPVYRSINEDVQVAVLVNDLSSANLAKVINATLSDTEALNTMERNCILAQAKYNWQQEEKTLIQFYNCIFA